MIQMWPLALPSLYGSLPMNGGRKRTTAQERAQIGLKVMVLQDKWDFWDWKKPSRSREKWGEKKTLTVSVWIWGTARALRGSLVGGQEGKGWSETGGKVGWMGKRPWENLRSRSETPLWRLMYSLTPCRAFSGEDGEQWLNWHPEKNWLWGGHLIRQLKRKCWLALREELRPAEGICDEGEVDCLGLDW